MKKDTEFYFYGLSDEAIETLEKLASDEEFSIRPSRTEECGRILNKILSSNEYRTWNERFKDMESQLDCYYDGCGRTSITVTT